MHMICPSVPISASTELTEFIYILCHASLGPLGPRAPCMDGSYAPDCNMEL